MNIIKQRIVYFESINYLNIPLVLFLRFLLFKVRYIDLSYGLRSERLISFLRRFGIHWKTLNDFDDKEESWIFMLAKNMAENAGSDYFDKSSSCRALSRDWGLSHSQQEKFRQVIRDRFYTNIYISLSKIIAFIKLDKKEHAGRIFYFIPNSPEFKSVSFKKLLVENEIRIPLLFKALTYVNSIFDIIDKFAFIIVLRKLRSASLYRAFKTKSKTKEPTEGNPQETLIERLKKKDVIYFPHKEIGFGNLFIKNYFFSSDGESGLFYKKIFSLFFEETDRVSRRYFKHFGMEFKEYFTNYIAKECSAIDFFIKYKKVFFQDIIKSYGFYHSIILLRSFLIIERNRLFFKKVNHLRLCILGYEQLFPKEINLALSINGIPVAAAQERFAGFARFGFMNHDYFFVWGRRMKEISEKYGKNKIQTYIPVGIPRLDQYYPYRFKQPSIKKYENLRKKHNFLIMALDVHFPEDLYENGMRENLAKSKHILNFYDALLYIAELLDVHIVIKGKINSYWSPFMEDYLEKINNSTNIEIESNVDTYKPYKILNYFDMIINLHTSLAEEAMVAGKSVIFYDPIQFIEKNFFHYDKYGLIANDQEELLLKTKLILEGRRLYEDERHFREFILNTFGESNDGKVTRRIQEYLDYNILNKRPDVRYAGQ